MRFFLAVLCLWLTIVPSQCMAADGVRISTFNIQNFGPKKASTASTLKYLAEVVHQFDCPSSEHLAQIAV